ncbi:MAG: hypothetical protein ACRDZP_06285 [Acidimicrobiales bacterium]
MAQASTAGETPWTVQSTPNPNAETVNELSAVSCGSGVACVAVGSQAANLSSPSRTLAEKWNGTSWRIQRTFLPGGASGATFDGISCTSATACVAVGGAIETTTKHTRNLAEAWNGRSWRFLPVSNPSGSVNGWLRAVSCKSQAACTAICTYDDAQGHQVAVAERWNGAGWHLQAVPKPVSTELFGVSCSGVHACIAVGYETSSSGTRPVAEEWNGTSWSMQSVPLPSGFSGGLLSAVACTSASACTATGGTFGSTSPLAERWNGVHWAVQSTPAPASASVSHQVITLNGVACVSTTSCSASGEYAPGGRSAYFLESWNGRSWTMVTTPTPTKFRAGALNGIACVVARCTAVGAWSADQTHISTLSLAN